MDSMRNKINELLDYNSFEELWPNIYTYDYLEFADYSEKLKTAREKSGETDAVITGIGMLADCKCVIVAFEPMFMMGSMGLVAGEKVARAFRLATKNKLPVVSISASGGARMQEGIVSLLQMAKTSTAVYKHSKKNLLYVSIINDPTLGGVTASFASLADIIIGERGARFGFTGRRIIEESTHENLPDDFQTVEYAKHYGMVDIIAEKNELKNLLKQILSLHKKRGAYHRNHRLFKNYSS